MQEVIDGVNILCKEDRTLASLKNLPRANTELTHENEEKLSLKHSDGSVSSKDSVGFKAMKTSGVDEAEDATI